MGIKAYNREIDNRIYFQYSQDIEFDYSSGRYPNGDESGFFWENNYIPVSHTVNGFKLPESGPHLWQRIKVGQYGIWSLPMPIGINQSNIDSIREIIIKDIPTNLPLYIDADGNLSHSEEEGYTHIPSGANNGDVLQYGIKNAYWGELNGYYTKSNLATPGEAIIDISNVAGIQEDPITGVVLPLLLQNGILSHVLGNGSRHIPEGGSIGQILINNGLGSVSWGEYLNDEYTAGNGLNLVSNEFSINELEIDHDNLLNYVLNKHIDHSLISINGSGLISGGGDLTASRTLSLDNSDIDHNLLTNYVSNEHIDHSTVAITGGGILSGGGDITLSREISLEQIDIDHNLISNSHNLTTDIDHDLITNTHNLTTDVDHNTITNTHNLTTDIDHNLTTNYIADEHINWKSTTENLNTSGTLTTGDITLPNVDGTSGYAIVTDGLGNLTWGEAGKTYTAGHGLDLVSEEFSVDETQLDHNILDNVEQAGLDIINGHISNTAQTLYGVKTFDSSPIVPTPTTDTQAANKLYVDSLRSTDSITVSDKFFNTTYLTENALFKSDKVVYRLPYDCKIVSIQIILASTDTVSAGTLNCKIDGNAGNVFNTDIPLDIAVDSNGKGGIISIDVNESYNFGTKNTDMHFFILAGAQGDAGNGQLIITTKPI